jgi:hypothetical protein
MPALDGGGLVEIVTQGDFLDVASRLWEQRVEVHAR